MRKPLIVLAVALVVAFAPATAADQPVRTEYLLFHGTVLLNDLCELPISVYYTARA